HRRGHQHGALADFQSDVRHHESHPGESRRQLDGAGGGAGAAAAARAHGGRTQRDTNRSQGERPFELGGISKQCLYRKTPSPSSLWAAWAKSEKICGSSRRPTTSSSSTRASCFPRKICWASTWSFPTFRI